MQNENMGLPTFERSGKKRSHGKEQMAGTQRGHTQNEFTNGIEDIPGNGHEFEFVINVA